MPEHQLGCKTNEILLDFHSQKMQLLENEMISLQHVILITYDVWSLNNIERFIYLPVANKAMETHATAKVFILYFVISTKFDDRFLNTMCFISIIVLLNSTQA